MKKVLSFILCAAMLLTLLPAAAAADVGGLAAFTDKKQYTESTFTDVNSGAWYADSVKTVYVKDIMSGIGAGLFGPDLTIPWSQAVTIAARLHAAYQGKDIPAVEGAWYAQFLNYAQENNLLPDICPEGDAVNSTPITREGLAVLFRSVLDEKDLPAVNDQAIPDLNAVRKEYRDIVSEMFAAGIFTGTNGGKFNPGGQATRAQVAAIIARLLCPGQRVSHDSRQNPYMADQMGNFKNGGLCARLGNTVYYIYMTPWQSSEDGYTERWSIIGRADSGETRKVYTISTDSEGLELLSVGPDGLLYFVQDLGEQYGIRQLDPETGAVQTVYKAGVNKQINSYLFYDGQLYVCVCEVLARSQIGRVSNGKMTVLATIPDWEDLYVGKTMYCFGGKMFYLQLAPRDSTEEDHLKILDLDTGKISSIPTQANEFAYQGGTAWTTNFSELKRFSLAFPELTETVRKLDGEFIKLYPNLYANGSRLYYQVSGAAKLWAVSSSGEMKELSAASSPYYEASAVNNQGIIVIPLSSLTAIDFRGIGVVLPDGKTTNLPAFLNQPYFLPGADQLTATDDQAVWDPTEREQNGLNVMLLKAYRSVGGDLALEVQISNDSSNNCTLLATQIELSGAAELETYISFDYAKISAGQSMMVTYVFPDGSLDITGKLAELEAVFSIYGSEGD